MLITARILTIQVKTSKVSVWINGFIWQPPSTLLHFTWFMFMNRLNLLQWHSNENIRKYGHLKERAKGSSRSLFQLLWRRTFFNASNIYCLIYFLFDKSWVFFCSSTLNVHHSESIIFACVFFPKFSTKFFKCWVKTPPILGKKNVIGGIFWISQRCLLRFDLISAFCFVLFWVCASQFPVKKVSPRISESL